jgi:hypothetical protein
VAEHGVAPRAQRTWLMILLALIALAAVYLIVADFARPGTDEVPVTNESGAPGPGSEPAR